MQVTLRSQNYSLAKGLEITYGIKPILARLLSARHEDFPSETNLRAQLGNSSPKGIATARDFPHFVELIQIAQKKELPILIFGDYDVDGILSTYIIYRLLSNLKITANYFLPSRFNEGYGLSSRIVTQAKEKGYQVIFALDCGTTNFDEVELASSLGMQVFILDHHIPASDTSLLKYKDAKIINPHLEQGISPFSSTGLAYCFALAVWEALGSYDSEYFDDFLELVVIATVADVVPIIGDNFLLCNKGWTRLLTTKNIGLRTLIEMLGLMGNEVLTYRDVGFSIAPAINAAGRLSHARLALELFLSANETQARNLSGTIIKLNRARRELQDRLFYEAARQCETFKDFPILVLYDPNWNQGITGVVAARIAETFKKPTLIFNNAGEEGQAIFSGRSVEGIDLLETLSFVRGLFTKIGGHSKAVGGMIKIENLPTLRQSLREVNLVTTDAKESVTLCDCDCSVRELLELEAGDILQMYPFGEGYPPPRFLVRSAKLLNKNLAGQDSTHLLLAITDGEAKEQLRLVGFNRSHFYSQLNCADVYDFAVEVELDNYGGKAKPFFRFLDFLSSTK